MRFTWLMLARAFGERSTTTCRRYLCSSNNGTRHCFAHSMINVRATASSQSLLHMRGTLQQTVLVRTAPPLNPQCAEEWRHSCIIGTSTMITESTLLSLLCDVSYLYVFLYLNVNIYDSFICKVSISLQNLCYLWQCNCCHCCHVHVTCIVAAIILIILDSETVRAWVSPLKDPYEAHPEHSLWWAPHLYAFLTSFPSAFYNHKKHRIDNWIWRSTYLHSTVRISSSQKNWPPP